MIEKIKALPMNRKLEILDFAEILESKELAKTPRINPEGLWADMNVNVTVEDIREMRKEAWKNFPREHFFDKEEIK